MLADFIDDTTPRMPKSDKAKAVASMDISVVSEQYDKEIRNAVRNVFSGALTRLSAWLILFGLVVCGCVRATACIVLAYAFYHGRQDRADAADPDAVREEGAPRRHGRRVIIHTLTRYIEI